MVHYGRHIIDRETGLCEICDRGAIHEIRTGKRPAKKYLYSNQDGRFTYRPDNEQTRPIAEPTPRYVRKPVYTEPLTARSRPVVREEPVVVQKRVVRRDYTPPDDIQYAPRARPTTLYYVDTSGQMVPQNEDPPDEPRRRYVVQNHHTPPPPRTTRVVHQRAQTPPPTIRRQHYSDPELVQRPYIVQPTDAYYYEPPNRPQMYHIEGAPVNNRFTTLPQRSPADDTPPPPPPPKVIYQNEPYRKPRPLEPIEPKRPVEPEVTVVKRVYKKLPPGRYEPPQDDYVPYENPAQPVRKVEKIYPSPRQYASSPPPISRSIPQKNPSIYYIQNTNGY